MFAKYGEITFSSLAREQETGKNRGFGFVNFVNHESAAKAVEEFNNEDFKGQDPYVGHAQNKLDWSWWCKQLSSHACNLPFPSRF